MRKKKPTILSVILIGVFILALLPSSGALSAEGDTYSDGQFNYAELADGSLSVAGFADGYSCSNLVIPSSYIGKTVTGIGAEAFKDNTVITSASIPSSITNIGYWAFYGCSNLIEIHFADSSYPMTLGYGIFVYAGLTSIANPGSWETIPSCTFEFCKSLESVSIPEGVTSIEMMSFFGASALVQYERKAYKRSRSPGPRKYRPESSITAALLRCREMKSEVLQFFEEYLFEFLVFYTVQPLSFG